MYATQITAKPRTNDPIDCSGCSRDSWRRMLRPIHRATPTFPMIQAATSAQITNGTTAMPTIDTASRKDTGPVSSEHQQAGRECGQRPGGQRLGDCADGPVEGEIQHQVDEEYGADNPPDPGQARHDRAPPQQPAAQPREQAFKPCAEVTRPDDNVLASGHESDRRVHRARNDDQVPANHGTGHHRRAAADDDERAVDRRGAGELRLAKDHDHVAIDPPFNRGRPRDDDGLTHRIAGVERVVLPDAHHLASPCLRVDRRLGGRLGRRFRRRCGRDSRLGEKSGDSGPPRRPADRMPRPTARQQPRQHRRSTASGPGSWLSDPFEDDTGERRADRRARQPHQQDDCERIDGDRLEQHTPDHSRSIGRHCRPAASRARRLP